MSTAQVFMHTTNSWDAATRSHPAGAFLEKYALVLEQADWKMPYTEYCHPEWTLAQANGTVTHGAHESWAALKELYGNFTAFQHEPAFIIIWETEAGWDVIGLANVFVNLPGGSAQGEQKVKDVKGREWDLSAPGAFRFQYVKDDKAKHGGILLKRTDIFSDSGPAVVTLLKRGVLKPEMLLST